MEIISGRKFVNEQVLLDGNDYRHCTFSGCTLIYRGGDVAFDDALYFKDNQFVFSDAAARSLEFFRRFGMVSKEFSGPFEIK